MTEILEELVLRYRRRTVFVSASAGSFEPWGEEAVTEFMRSLGSSLIGIGARVATGLGLGVGNALFTGAVEQVTRHRKGHIEDFLVIRPFPQALPDGDRQAFWEQYRQDIIGDAGIAIFLFGNKLVDGGLVLANGMKREFEIARQHRLVTIPVGATGSMAAELAAEALAEADKQLAGLESGGRETVAELNKETDDLSALVKPITELIAKLLPKRGQ